jgi:hypothetical protein
MTHRVRESRITRRHFFRLERARLELLAIPDDEVPFDLQWHRGYCAGLLVAQQLIMKGE